MRNCTWQLLVLMGAFAPCLHSWSTAALIACRRSSSSLQQQHPCHGRFQTKCQMLYAQNDGNEQQQRRRYRARVLGVSVSATGFWTILRLSSSLFWPVRITTQDQSVASSPEALTFLQLLAGVDMAGTVLPPTLLAEIVAIHVEETISDQKNHTILDPETVKIYRSIATYIHDQIQSVFYKLQKQQQLPNEMQNTVTQQESLSFADQSPWIRSRLTLPNCILNEVVIVWDETEDNDFSVQLQVNVVDHGSITVLLDEEILKDVCYQYQPSVSAAFVGLSLSLRYKAPITIVEGNSTHDESGGNQSRYYDSESALLKRFPNYRGTQDVVQVPADRSAESIQRGFEIHKLQAALDLARRKGDDQAAAKIRKAIDILDEKSANDIPVQPDSDTSSMQ